MDLEQPLLAPGIGPQDAVGLGDLGRDIDRLVRTVAETSWPSSLNQKSRWS